ncbi:TRAM domain-containing protein [Candidatus Saccharibacteria bacterium]|nr:TRAM domain-containing protein [Candidatus Saccharibacteria bacterium]
MDSFVFLVALGIFSETTYLTIKKLAEKSNHPKGRRKVYIDTSALIDGRILNVAKTGFLYDEFVIPRSVTRELQLLADGKDLLKRNRARDGLNTVNELERVEYIDTNIMDDSHLGRMLVDERLLTLARENHGVILTCDYNLEKVATTEGIQVLNINDLSITLENKYHQGDKIHIKIVEKGHNPRQGIGHLDDGTMVVVDGADDKIGKEIDVNILKFHQTSSGRMIFAEVSGVKKRNSKRAIRQRKTTIEA